MMVIRTLLILLLVSTTTLAESLKYRVESETLKFEEGKLSIEIEYPQVSGLGESLDRGLNLEFQKRAEAASEAFKKDAAEMKADLPVDSQDWNPPQSLTMGFDVKQASTELLVILVWGSEFTGGAHPNPTFYLLMLDPTTGQRVAVSDLFTPRVNYLERLSEVSRLQLKNDPDNLMGDSEWVNTGTEPKRENFALVWPEGEDLVIMFPPYQVAPYAAGPQELRVPQKDFHGILSTRFFDQ